AAARQEAREAMRNERAVGRRVWASVLMVMALTITAGGQQATPSEALDAQLRRIFNEQAYAVPRFGPARWLPDGSGYTTVEPAVAPGRGSDILRYDAASGARTVLVAGTRLVPPGATAPLTIADYVWSDDGRHLLVFT